MAVTYTLFRQDNTPVSIGVETYVVTTGAADVSFTITPAAIKSILDITWVPMNAAAMAAMTGTKIAATFVVGAATIDVDTAVLSQFLVTVRGVVA